MGSEFLVYLRLGFEHIADPRAYDHILFIVALTVMYPLVAWRQVLVLVTAFTVGHSITLALATLELIWIPTDLIELLIPVTIFSTAALNLLEVFWAGGSEGSVGGKGAWSGGGEGGMRRPPAGETGADAAGIPGDYVEPIGARRLKYGLALGFGLIHGMGFSNFLRAVLGREESIALPLFAFNVGLEVGQVLIVALVLTATAVATTSLRLSRRRWIVAVSAVTATLALYIVWDRLPL